MADRAPETTQEPGKTPNATRTPDTREQAREMGTQVQERAHQVGTQAREMGTQARDWAQEKGHQLQRGAQEASRQVGASTSQLANMGSEAMDQLEESLEDKIRSKPLQSMLIAAGAGMLLGFLLRK
jgi:ElaB/YqjD/DUF883 family membrane-anchored ribosome-binding protein